VRFGLGLPQPQLESLQPEWLGTAEFTYNNKVHMDTKVSLFKVNQEQDPRMGFEMRKKGKYGGVEKMRSMQEEAKAAL